jgi:hypothetical protein
MGVKTGHFPDFGHGQAHVLGQGAQMAGREMAIFILDKMQEFDQQIAVAGARAQQRLHLCKGVILILAALGRCPPLAAPGFPHAFAACLIECHLPRPFACLPQQVPKRAHSINIEYP